MSKESETRQKSNMPNVMFFTEKQGGSREKAGSSMALQLTLKVVAIVLKTSSRCETVLGKHLLGIDMQGLPAQMGLLSRVCIVLDPMSKNVDSLHCLARPIKSHGGFNAVQRKNSQPSAIRFVTHMTTTKEKSILFSRQDAKKTKCNAAKKCQGYRV